MNSKIFDAAVKIIFPIQILLSIYLLLRGHNSPGGGFIGGLTLAMAFILRALATNEEKRMPKDPRWLIGLGLLCALSSGVIPFFTGDQFLTGLWSDFSFLGFTPSTVFLFDLGVYLLVTGMVLEVISLLSRELLD
jgi:multicomponent Na+:H+ antiporter subunit B